jgi:hypothetical protein
VAGASIPEQPQGHEKLGTSWDSSEASPPPSLALRSLTLKWLPALTRDDVLLVTSRWWQILG